MKWQIYISFNLFKRTFTWEEIISIERDYEVADYDKQKS